ncbi:MAG TPA: hypothetical protein VGZ91_00890 [Candidatus Sulfotelmatobacter sp.]|jgi:hypothetical protein|nr:hypothetical protein [Candidatus Sulfotelmatobacter sp.]
MQSYAVYTRENDTQVWTLENVTNCETAKLAKEVYDHLGVQTLVIGPAAAFPQFIEI